MDVTQFKKTQNTFSIESQNSVLLALDSKTPSHAPSLSTEQTHQAEAVQISGDNHGAVDGAHAPVPLLNGSNVFFFAFLVFIALVIWKGGKAILAKLDDRGITVHTRLREAQDLKVEAEQVLNDYKRKQEEVGEKAERILHSAKEETMLIRKKAEEDLQERLSRREKMAEQRIVQAEASALAEVRSQSVDRSVEAAREVLEKGLSDSKKSDLIDDSLLELKKILNA